ncbi:hypothetical protein KHQ81_00285 [Mycoplasmatota bacterium]|nr:hypothetical protein KHQ81_00285 [Mycoplasmatota bacterium]
MKTNKILTIIFLLLSLVLFNSCSPNNKENDELIYEFTDKEQLPERILLTGNEENKNYTFLLSNYTNKYNKIAFGNSLEEMNIIYTASGDSDIEEIVNNFKYISWFETIKKSDESIINQIKVYNKETKSINTIFEKIADESSPYQFNFIGLSGNNILYIELDYENSKGKIVQYNILEDKSSVFLELPFTNNELTRNCPLYFINVKDNLLITSTINNQTVDLRVYNIETKELIHTITLPEYIGLVYYADFDMDTKTFAIYYYKIETNDIKSGEGVGIINIVDNELKEIFTPSSTTYLYHEKISISGNLIYFVLQKVVTGAVYDHYIGIQYNISNHHYEEVKGAIYLELHEELYAVCFDKKEAIQKINYYKYPSIK